MHHTLPEPAAEAGSRAMTERILKTPMEVESYIDQVRGLGDANRSALGFLPASAYSVDVHLNAPQTRGGSNSSATRSAGPEWSAKPTPACRPSTSPRREEETQVTDGVGNETDD